MDPSSSKTFGRVHSQRKRLANVNKHIRIANATSGHEREVHVEKARKLAKRYGLPSLEIK